MVVLGGGGAFLWTRYAWYNYPIFSPSPYEGDGGEEHFKWASEDSELDQTIHAAQLFAAEAAALGLSEVLPIFLTEVLPLGLTEVLLLGLTEVLPLGLTEVLSILNSHRGATHYELPFFISLSSEFGRNKPVKARFWQWPSGKSPECCGPQRTASWTRPSTRRNSSRRKLPPSASARCNPFLNLTEVLPILNYHS